MSIAIADEQVLDLVRAEIAAAVERERPLIRQEILESFKWVTEETGIALLEIGGKEPARTFRRLMSTYKVETLKVAGMVRYRWRKSPAQNAGLSIEELIEKHVVKASGKRTRAGQAAPKLEALAAA